MASRVAVMCSLSTPCDLVAHSENKPKLKLIITEAYLKGICGFEHNMRNSVINR